MKRLRSEEYIGKLLDSLGRLSKRLELSRPTVLSLRCLSLHKKIKNNWCDHINQWKCDDELIVQGDVHNVEAIKRGPREKVNTRLEAHEHHNQNAIKFFISTVYSESTLIPSQLIHRTCIALG